MTLVAHHTGPIPFFGPWHTLCQSSLLMLGACGFALVFERGGTSRSQGRRNEGCMFLMFRHKCCCYMQIAASRLRFQVHVMFLIFNLLLLLVFMMSINGLVYSFSFPIYIWLFLFSVHCSLMLE